MNLLFIKRKSYFKENKNYYTITTLYGDVVSLSFVNEDTFKWFSNSECGDEIPEDFYSIGLYDTKEGLRARITIDINK